MNTAKMQRWNELLARYMPAYLRTQSTYVMSDCRTGSLEASMTTRIVLLSMLVLVVLKFHGLYSYQRHQGGG
jgi:hypothetical protein